MNETIQPEVKQPETDGPQTDELQTSEQPSGETTLDFTDAEFVGALRRTMWNIGVLGVVLAVLLTIFYGWRTGLMLLVGAAISLTGIWEWRRMMAAINARLEARQSPHSLTRTILGFVLRLAMAGAVLYGSLKYLEGSIYALVAGLSLAMIMLTVEAFRLLKH
jgi:hypothetical protein